eukprot:m.240177 g.240177  ORF g.240177 m.240177 type:complete len:931 (-) comp15301_c0_seq2:193-2985(-)
MSVDTAVTAADVDRALKHLTLAPLKDLKREEREQDRCVLKQILLRYFTATCKPVKAKTGCPPLTATPSRARADRGSHNTPLVRTPLPPRRRMPLDSTENVTTNAPENAPAMLAQPNTQSQSVTYEATMPTVNDLPEPVQSFLTQPSVLALLIDIITRPSRQNAAVYAAQHGLTTRPQKDSPQLRLSFAAVSLLLKVQLPRHGRPPLRRTSCKAPKRPFQMFSNAIQQHLPQLVSQLLEVLHPCAQGSFAHVSTLMGHWLKHCPEAVVEGILLKFKQSTDWLLLLRQLHETHVMVLLEQTITLACALQNPSAKQKVSKLLLGLSNANFLPRTCQLLQHKEIADQLSNMLCTVCRIVSATNHCVLWFGDPKLLISSFTLLLKNPYSSSSKITYAQFTASQTILFGNQLSQVSQASKKVAMQWFISNLDHLIDAFNKHLNISLTHESVTALTLEWLYHFHFVLCTVLQHSSAGYLSIVNVFSDTIAKCVAVSAASPRADLLNNATYHLISLLLLPHPKNTVELFHTRLEPTWRQLATSMIRHTDATAPLLCQCHLLIDFLRLRQKTLPGLSAMLDRLPLWAEASAAAEAMGSQRWALHEKKLQISSLSSTRSANPAHRKLPPFFVGPALIVPAPQQPKPPPTPTSYAQALEQHFTSHWLPPVPTIPKDHTGMNMSQHLQQPEPPLALTRTTSSSKKQRQACVAPRYILPSRSFDQPSALEGLTRHDSVEACMKKLSQAAADRQDTPLPPRRQRSRRGSAGSAPKLSMSDSDTEGKGSASSDMARALQVVGSSVAMHRESLDEVQQPVAKCAKACIKTNTVEEQTKQTSMHVSSQVMDVDITRSETRRGQDFQMPAELSLKGCLDEDGYTAELLSETQFDSGARAMFDAQVAASCQSSHDTYEGTGDGPTRGVKAPHLQSVVTFDVEDDDVIHL